MLKKKLQKTIKASKGLTKSLDMKLVEVVVVGAMIGRSRSSFLLDDT